MWICLEKMQAVHDPVAQPRLDWARGKKEGRRGMTGEEVG